MLGHRNRRGNITDSHDAAAFLRSSLQTVREDLAFSGTVEFHVDSAFFTRDFLAACDGPGVEYAVKVR